MSFEEVTRELHGSAVAAAQAISLLRTRVCRTQESLAAVAAGDCSGSQLASLLQLHSDALVLASHPVTLSVMEAADRRDGLVQWFEAYDVVGGWDLASPLVQAGLGQAFLDEVVARVGEDAADDAIRWLSHAVDSDLLLREIEQSTRRILKLVAGLERSW